MNRLEYFFHQLNTALHAISPYWLGTTVRHSCKGLLPYDFYYGHEPVTHQCLEYGDARDFDDDLA